MMWATQRTRIRYGGKNPDINTHINSLELVHVDVKVSHDAIKRLQSLGPFLHMIDRSHEHVFQPSLESVNVQFVLTASKST